jgi:hypothetical protein
VELEEVGYEVSLLGWDLCWLMNTKDTVALLVSLLENYDYWAKLI